MRLNQFNLKKAVTQRSLFIQLPLLIFMFFYAITPSQIKADVDSAFAHLRDIMDKYHKSFDVYTDEDVGGNHFIPSGWMGDWGDIQYDANFMIDPHGGISCTKVVYSGNCSQGYGWAGIYWQYPENNWGDKGGAYDLRGATKLTFWVRGQNGGEKVEIKVGGINRFPYHNPYKPFQDSFELLSTGIVTLDSTWNKYELDLVRPDSYAVYTEKEAGSNNHYIPSGWYNGSNNMTFDDHWTDNPHSGRTCIKITWNGQSGNDGLEWNGVAWQQPENNWVGNSGLGYDLTGATKLTFWARTDEPGLELKFLVGYPDDSSGEIFIDGTWVRIYTEWHKYEIDLSGRDLSDVVCGFAVLFNDVHDPDPDGCTFYLDDIKYDKLINKDLSHMIGGFCWVADTMSNPDGCAFYLDEIKYELDSSTVMERLQEPHFLLSYQPTCDSQDFIFRNTSHIYDNALAMLAFMADSSNEDSWERAKILADAFVKAQQNDRYFNDGRLRNAYQSGDLLDRATGKARVPGWWDYGEQKWFEDEYSVSTQIGNLAWVMIALLEYYKKRGGSDYLEAADKLGAWIYDNCYDTRGSGGYAGGYEGWEPDSVNPEGQAKIKWKSTEHNLDVYIAFTKLSQIYQELGDTIWQDWQERALHARDFVQTMWDSTEGHFWTGTDTTGININKDNIPLDVNPLGLMALDGINKYGVGIAWAETACLVNPCPRSCGFKGFDFNTDKDGVWFEGTAQMCISFQIKGEDEKSDTFLIEIEKAQASANNGNGKGIVAACHDSVSTGFGGYYFNRLHIAATSWYILAKKKSNPFTAVEELNIEQKELPSRFHLFQNYPNPFNPVTQIEYTLKKDCSVNLTIYDILGQKITTLINEHQSAGHKRVRWDGKNDKGQMVGSGVYLYKIKADNFTQSKKMILIK